MFKKLIYWLIGDKQIVELQQEIKQYEKSIEILMNEKDELIRKNSVLTFKDRNYEKMTIFENVANRKTIDDLRTENEDQKQRIAELQDMLIRAQESKLGK
jgi:myo-inositol catabolism protein IolC